MYLKIPFLFKNGKEIYYSSLLKIPLLITSFISTMLL